MVGTMSNSEQGVCNVCECEREIESETECVLQFLHVVIWVECVSLYTQHPNQILQTTCRNTGITSNSH